MSRSASAAKDLEMRVEVFVVSETGRMDLNLLEVEEPTTDGSDLVRAVSGAVLVCGRSGA